MPEPKPISSCEESGIPARPSHMGGNLVTQRDLWDMEDRILHKLKETMSAISDFNTKLTAYFDRQDKAVADLQTDVKAIQDALTQLNNNPGTISPADQALLDTALTRAGSVADKLDALDAATPPPVPPTP